MPYDRTRLRADFPDWHEPLSNLVGGIATGVISIAELDRDIGRDSLSIFLRGYGAGLPTTPLRDFLRRVRKLQAESVIEPATYQSLHKIGRRSKNGFWQYSVSLGRVLRREKFSWDEDPLGGLAKLHFYLEAARFMCKHLGVEPFTNYGRYVLFDDLRIQLPWWQLINAADFDALEDIVNAIERLPLEALDRVMLPFNQVDRNHINALRNDHGNLANKMANVKESLRRSDLFANIRWQSEGAPREIWATALAPPLELEVNRASNGFWWVHPKSNIRITGAGI